MKHYKNHELMRAAGSKKGDYDPEAPDQWKWVMLHSKDPLESAMAWIKSGTTAWGHDSPFCVDQYGRSTYTKHLANAKGWKLHTAQNVLSTLHAQGRIRLDPKAKRIWYCADIPQAHMPEEEEVPPQPLTPEEEARRRKSERLSFVQRNWGTYVVDFIENLRETQQESAFAKLEATVDRRREFFADGMAALRVIADRVDDTTLLDIGIPKKRLPKRRDPECKCTPLKTLLEPSFVQSCFEELYKPQTDFVDARASDSAAASTLTSAHSDAVATNKKPSSSSSLLPKKDDDAPKAQRPKTTQELAPILEALKPVGVTEVLAVKKLFALCRDEAPDCTPEEVAIFVQAKIHIKKGKKVGNWVGYLQISVPPMFQNPGFADWRASRVEEAPQKTSPVDSLAVDIRFVHELPNHPEAEELRTRIDQARRDDPKLYEAAAKQARLEIAKGASGG